MKKIYSYAIDWAVVRGRQPKPIWHNEPGAGGTFNCEEDVETIRVETVKVLRQYTQNDYAWEYAAADACEHDETGVRHDTMKDIEVAVIAPCQQPKGNMIRIRATEDWNSWIQNASCKLNAI